MIPLRMIVSWFGLNVGNGLEDKRHLKPPNRYFSNQFQYVQRLLLYQVCNWQLMKKNKKRFPVLISGAIKLPPGKFSFILVIDGLDVGVDVCKVLIGDKNRSPASPWTRPRLAESPS